ncbi:MAG: hypothetical protein UX83_C0011G0002 [Candidatus Wolfebacteria bacterium GW2011_GWE2_47_12]|nr:MAG: hypothetical protein UX83_C0011G0002 [Candidatus Wolfebacteria bacterium GW2011_GWE2_47_12]
MDIKKLLSEIERQANGILRDINECDKVYIQADHIKGLVMRLRIKLGIER